jgi:hypothetical protein
MAVSAANTNIVGRGLGLAFTDSDTSYLYFKSEAEKRIAIDAPDMTDRDHCTMLMICHMYACADPVFGMNSHSSGGFSGSQAAGSTIYSIEYDRLVSAGQPAETDGTEGSVIRSDAEMPELQLDDGEVPRFFSED